MFTHDSIGLGEDGPTHQSVEHAAACASIPNLDVWRPCDTVESAVAWIAAVERRDGPSALLFSRQNLPFQKRDAHDARRRCGAAATCSPTPQDPQAVIIATGSEVQLALGAQQKLAEEGIAVRVVSMPCTACSTASRRCTATRCCSALPRVAVEAGVTDFWRKYVGLEGAVIGIDRYGESAPGREAVQVFRLHRGQRRDGGERAF